MGGGKDPPDPNPGDATLNDGLDPKPKQYTDIIYSAMDAAPYRIYIELKQKGDRNNKINKFALGAYLRGMAEFKAFITDMKYLGQHKVMVFVSSYTKANQLVEMVNKNSDNYKAYVPRHLVCISGMVAGVPTDIDVEDIKADIQCDVPIVDVKRMTKRGENNERIPINRLIVTFRAHELPTSVRIFCCYSKIAPFTPRIVVCLKCLRFGHRTDNCRGAKRCEKCTERHENEEEFTNCNNAQSCLHCRSDKHKSTDPECPERKRQHNIKSLMARKNLTFTEARLQFPVLSQNIYEPLSKVDEFPMVNETFAEMTRDNYNWKDPLKEQWIRTNQERKSIEAAVKTYKEQKDKEQKQTRKRQRANQANYQAAQTTEQRNIIIGRSSSLSNNGVALNNPFAVTDKERWECIMREAQETNQRATQESMMSFYAEFLEILGSNEQAKEKFKQCTNKHFNLAKAVVLPGSSKQH